VKLGKNTSYFLSRIVATLVVPTGNLLRQLNGAGGVRGSGLYALRAGGSFASGGWRSYWGVGVGGLGGGNREVLRGACPGHPPHRQIPYERRSVPGKELATTLNGRKGGLEKGKKRSGGCERGKQPIGVSFPRVLDYLEEKRFIGPRKKIGRGGGRKVEKAARDSYPRSKKPG